MSRPVDAEALKDRVEQFANENQISGNTLQRWMCDRFIAIVDNAPTIVQHVQHVESVGRNRDCVECDCVECDCVEVVRCVNCKECEERLTANYLPFLYCRLHEHSVSWDAYCSWGERKDEQTAEEETEDNLL